MAVGAGVPIPLWRAVAASLASVGRDPATAQRLAGQVLHAVRATATASADHADWVVRSGDDGLLVAGPVILVNVQGPPTAPGRIEVTAADRLMYIADAVPEVLPSTSDGGAKAGVDPGAIDGVHVHVRISDDSQVLVDASFPRDQSPEDHLDLQATSARVDAHIRQRLGSAPMETLDGPLQPGLRPGPADTLAPATTAGPVPVPAAVTAPPIAVPIPLAVVPGPPPADPSAAPEPTWLPTHVVVGPEPRAAWASTEPGDPRAWWLSAGEPLRLLVLDEGWAQVEDRRRRQGWMKARNLKEVRVEPPTGAWQATHHAMADTDVWPRPDPRRPAPGRVAAGTPIRLLGLHVGWAHVDIASGHDGWVDLEVLDAVVGGVVH